MKMIGHDHFICHSYCHFSVLSHILLSGQDMAHPINQGENSLIPLIPQHYYKIFFLST